MRSLFLGIISGAALVVAAIPVASQVVLPPGQTAYDVASGTQDITQQITGTGGINKTGNGILQFSYTGTPATDYSGPTNVIAGTLSAFGANTLSAVSAVTVNGGATLSISGENRIASLAGAGTVRKNGLILTVGGDNTSTTFSGVLEGRINRTLSDSGLIKIGTGTLTLAGGGSDGFVRIDAGTIRAGATRGLLAASYDIASGATLDLNNFDNSINGLIGAGTVKLGSGALSVGSNVMPALPGVFTGTISGTGGINLFESLRLGGTATYSGPTTLMTTHSSLGAEAVNAFSPNSSLVIQTASSSVFLQGFDQTIGSLSYRGLVGTGRVDLGAARLTLGGDNTDTVYNGTIFGTGGVTKNGSGVFTLAYNNTYTGTTIVNAGILAVAQTQASTFVVNGGTLTGGATIGGLTVNGGTVAPGNAVRTLTVAGNVNLGPGSTYQVNADPVGQASRISATGTASLGGTLQILGGSGLFAPTTSYTILSAGGGVSGTFSSVTSDLAFLTPSLSYGGSVVSLTLTRNDAGFEEVASTPDQSSSAGAIESAGFGNPIFNAVLGASADQARAAFTAISGQIHSAVLTAEMGRGQDLRNGLLDHLAQSSAESDGVQVWGEVNASWLGLDDRANVSGMSGRGFSLNAGADVGVGDGWRLGVTIGYDHSTQGLRDGNGQSRVSGGHAGIYWKGLLDNFALRGGALFQAGTAKVDRNIAFLGFSDATSSSQDIGASQVFSEVGYPLLLDGWNLQPFAGLGWIEARAGGVRETGGAAALNVEDGTLAQSYSSLGVGVSGNMQLLGLAWKPSLRAAWQHGFSSGVPTRRAQLLSGSDFLTSAGAALAQNQAVVNAGFDLGLDDGANLSVGYQGALAAGSQINGLRADFRLAL